MRYEYDPSDTAARISGDFSTTTRTKGRSYYEEGRVHVDSFDIDWLEATVRGSGRMTYDVSLDRLSKSSEDVLEATCECPYFGSGFLCKHVWATVLAARNEGWIDDTGRRRVVVVWAGDGEVLVHHPEPEIPAWQRIVHAARAISGDRPESTLPQTREIWYVLDSNHFTGDVSIKLYQREERARGGFGAFKAFRLERHDLDDVATDEDRLALSLLFGGEAETDGYSSPWGYRGRGATTFRLPPAGAPFLLRTLAGTGRLCLGSRVDGKPSGEALSFEPDGTWTHRVALEAHAAGYKLTGTLRRGDQTLPLHDVRLLPEAGLAVAGRSIIGLGRLTTSEIIWLGATAGNEELIVPATDVQQFARDLVAARTIPQIEWPAELGWSEIVEDPRPTLVLQPSPGAADELIGKVAFRYGDVLVTRRDPQSHWVDEPQKLVRRRDVDAEKAAIDRLVHVPAVRSATLDGAALEYVRLPRAALTDVVTTLTAEGWTLEASGRMVKSANGVDARVEPSGIDWFELRAGVRFDEHEVELPALLAAVRAGEMTIALPDGSSGVVPAEWVKRCAKLLGLGRLQGDAVAFHRSQVAFLDAILADFPDPVLAPDFSAIRDKIRAFAGVAPRKAARGFRGTLRPYQEEGLGWLASLEELGFGGCLADDMGLGKTIQVLAHLQARVGKRQVERRPSLVVAPRSLIHNWREEASRFCPKLRVLDFSGLTRGELWTKLGDADLVLTTYGVLRRDVERLRALRFDYVILDEAQAIKNEGALVSKAARKLDANHRLALSGTPVENHLGELGSILSFLNPGMISSETLTPFSTKKGEPPDEQSLGRLAKALRPFILRRTKEQVLPDLPAKTEQTLICELEPKQRKHYDELRRHYRASLTAEVKEKGFARAKIHVLEALLRLRQAACHSALIDPKRSKDASAKLDTLVDQLREVVDGGHKALVFSQFTSLLALVKPRLDKEGIPYEYLDGQTRDRQGVVRRFQDEDGPPVFLISLKAGGVGLNLTAADYCFILDPWWNPAIEAQAIDRAHRLGQSRPVFAYRLIARDTVEEKILQLQEHKRHLADAIVTEENGALAGLSLEDIEMLLS